MILIPLDKMTVPPRRQRWQMQEEHLLDLADSIQRLGLLHPIVVRPLNGIYQLVCGQRRLEAVKRLKDRPYKCDGQDVPLHHIPVTFLSELDELSRKEAELEENLLRVDLDWKERDQAIADLSALRKQQNPKHTQQDTAKELAAVTGTSVPAAASVISRAEIVARHLGDPAIAAARNSNEAYSMISRRLQAQFETRLAAATGIISPHTFIQGDLREEIWKLPTEHFDCIIADPPYGISAQEFGDAGASHQYDDTPAVAISLLEQIIHRGIYITKPSAHMYLFCDIELFLKLRDMAQSVGWSTQRTPIIWYKGNIGFDPYPGIGFKRCSELLLYCWKGNKPHRVIMEDIVSVRGEPKEGHAAAKPMDLYRKFLSRSCIPGDSVLDPCCGSGTIFPASTLLSLKATGIEVDAAFADMSRARMGAKE